jgi:hypothetical protein
MKIIPEAKRKRKSVMLGYCELGWVYGGKGRGIRGD